MLSKALYSWIAFPVYAWQGISVRLRIERLLPAVFAEVLAHDAVRRAEEMLEEIFVALA